MRDLKAALFAKFQTSSIFAIRNFLYTGDKQGDLVLLDPWPGQMILQVCVESQRQAGFPVRVVENKSRQIGYTAWDLALAFHAAMHPRTKVGVLVKEVDVAEDLMLRVNTMYNSLPRFMRPMKRIDNPAKLIFDNPNHRERDENPGLNSQIHITVPQALRGFTPHFFIWSEAAFCREWKEVVQGVLSGIATNRKSVVIIDTTPNGTDPFYYPLFMESVERNPKWVAAIENFRGAPTRDQIANGIFGVPDRPREGFVPAMCPWRFHPEFSTQNEDPSAHLAAITDEDIQHLEADLGKNDKYGGEEEIELRDRYGVSIYKLFWRRWKLANDTAGADEYERLMVFHQEYLSSHKSGFVRFSRGAFDTKGLEKLSRWLGPGSRYGPRPPAARGYLRREDNGRIYVDQEWHSQHLEVRIWAGPEPGEKYVMFVDTATAYYSKESDSTVAQVLRKRDNKQVAILDCKVPPSEYEEQIYLLYQWFNHPYYAIEMEGDGYDLMYRLFARGCQNVYRYKRHDREIFEETKDLGWETNRKTRSIIQNAAIYAISHRDREGHPEPAAIVCDEKTMQEILDLTRDQEGFIENASGHDDAAFAWMGALALADDPWGGLWQEPRTPAPERELNALVRKMGLTFAQDRSQPKYEQL